MYKDADQMKEAAKLIWYEHDQFSWAASIVNGAGPADADADSVRAFKGAVEVFLLHARTLRDFFLRSRPLLPKQAETDILAADFFDSPGEWSKPVFSYLIEQRTKERLDRALAHVTYDRLGYAKSGKGWRTTLIANEIDAAWEGFLAALPADRRTWFKI